VRLALLPPGGDTDMAGLEGVLRPDGPCLYVIRNDPPGSRTLPAFALSDVRWDAETETLRAGGTVIAKGQRILLTGGEPHNPAALQWIQRPDPSCDASDLFVAGMIAPAKALSRP